MRDPFSLGFRHQVTSNMVVYRSGTGMYINGGGGQLQQVTQCWTPPCSSMQSAFVDRSMCAQDLATADIDADGDLDVLVANDAGVNAMFFNDGNGALQRAVEGAFVTDVLLAYAGNSPGRADYKGSFALEVADIDGDNDLDVLVIGKVGVNNAIYINDGSGALTRTTEGAFVNDITNRQGGADMIPGYKVIIIELYYIPGYTSSMVSSSYHIVPS